MPPDDGAGARGGALLPVDAVLLSASHLLQCYEAIAYTSHDMLAAARAGDWDTVADLELRCRVLIAELAEASRDGELTVDERRRRLELLRSILADDAEIRARARDHRGGAT
jgi:flagellar protein FliT